MRRAIDLAAGLDTHPNPRVGALIVDDDGQPAGEGAHHGAGQDHAEVVALRMAGERARGKTLYVTLEPCTHQGRTPPCVDAVIAAGITRVVVACADPDTRVAGKGVRRLREAGIEVEEGLLEAEARSLDPGYFHQRETGLPRVVMKVAMTLDGAVAATDGTSQWITSEEARADAHRLRAGVDAVMVGAGTLRSDNPRLDARIEGVHRQPVPVIMAGVEDLPTRAHIWERKPIVVSAFPRALPTGRLLVVPGPDDRPDPEKAARALAESGIYDILLEGGPSLAGSWWRAGLVTRGVLYLAGLVAGGTGIGVLGGVFATMSQARPVSLEKVDRVGPDLRIEFS